MYMEIMNLALENLEKVGFGAILFLMVYLSNMGLGAWRSVKIEGMDFDWQLFVQSLIKFTILGISIAMLSMVVSIIPVYVSYVGIEIDPSVMDTLNSIAIIGAFLTATIKYAMDGINKIKEILGIG